MRHASCLLFLALVTLSCVEERGGMVATGSRPENTPSIDSELDDVRMDARLTFIDGERQETLSVEDMLALADPTVIAVDDPNHGHKKRYVAIPLEPILVEGLERPVAKLAGKTLVFEAMDGYASPVDGAIFAESGAHLALDDLAQTGWEPIGEKNADPAPLYVVWVGADRDPHRFPWPWALSSVRVVDAKEEYAAAAPPENASGAVMEGHQLFMRECIRCHAVNRAGGRLGPELNVPQNILEYRPEEQVRAYIKNPLTFRYGNMPAFPSLMARELDALIAYLRAMKENKLEG